MKSRHWLHFFLAAFEAGCLISAGIVIAKGYIVAYAVLAMSAAVTSIFCHKQIVKNYLKDIQS